MISLKRCKEIFSDNTKFEKIRKDRGEYGFYHVNMKRLAKDGFHYDFGFRKRPNGFNDVAEIYFGKWTPLDTFVVAFDICDEKFLLKVIEYCHNNGLETENK